MKYFLSDFPTPDKLFKEADNFKIPDFRESNCNINTSSPLNDDLIQQAKKENISVLGINNHLVTNGFDQFHDSCIKHGIFPLFNMSLAGVLKEEQRQGILINDNFYPGRINISAKGLDYPFKAGWFKRRQLEKMRKHDQQDDGNNLYDLKKLFKIILSSGGIPFYTVQLDSSGSLSEFEKDRKKMAASLRAMGIQCLEFIPGRYNPELFIEYARYFNNSGFIITFGTNSNSSATEPLKVLYSNSIAPDELLTGIAWNGACIIAAHQYLRASGRQGYILPDGSHSIKQKKELTILGKIIIEYFINKLYEKRNPD